MPKPVKVVFEADINKMTRDLKTAFSGISTGLSAGMKGNVSGFIGGMGQAFGGAGGASGMSAMLGKLSGVLAVLTIVAEGIGKIVDFMAQASPALGGTFKILGQAMMLFFKPFGDFLAIALRPLVMYMLMKSRAFNEKAAEIMKGYEPGKEKEIGGLLIKAFGDEVIKPMIGDMLRFGTAPYTPGETTTLPESKFDWTKNNDKINADFDTWWSGITGWFGTYFNFEGIKKDFDTFWTGLSTWFSDTFSWDNVVDTFTSFATSFANWIATTFTWSNLIKLLGINVGGGGGGGGKAGSVGSGGGVSAPTVNVTFPNAQINNPTLVQSIIDNAARQLTGQLRMSGLWP